MILTLVPLRQWELGRGGEARPEGRASFLPFFQFKVSLRRRLSRKIHIWGSSEATCSAQLKGNWGAAQQERVSGSGLKLYEYYIKQTEPSAKKSWALHGMRAFLHFLWLRVITCVSRSEGSSCLCPPQCQRGCCAAPRLCQTQDKSGR